MGTKLGRWGEEHAVRYLEQEGYQVIARNWRRREGELDLVALHGSTLVFVEVKTRRTTTFGPAEESVDARKQAQLARIAQRYLDEHPQLHFAECRFDVLVVDLANHPPQIRHYLNAFYPPDVNFEV